MSSNGKIAVVTGGSSGIGRAVAFCLRDAGCTVYEISRNGTSSDGILHVTGDVSDTESANNAVMEILSKEGKIDILVNNAGCGISGAVEFTDIDLAKSLMDVNFFGTVNMTRAVIPVMRKNGGGRIVNISSVAAPIAIPFQTYYSVSKAAVNSFSCALANEVRPFGISVCAIMPGDIRTGFTSARKKMHDGDDIYGGRIERSVAAMERDEENGMEPEKAGRFICNIALKKKVKPLYAVGAKYSLFVMLSRILPSAILYRLVGTIYAK